MDRFPYSKNKSCKLLRDLSIDTPEQRAAMKSNFHFAVPTFRRRNWNRASYAEWAGTVFLFLSNLSYFSGIP